MIQTTPGATTKAELDAPAGLDLSGRVTDNGVLVLTVPESAVSHDESYEAVFASPEPLGRMSFEWIQDGDVIAREVLSVQSVVTPVQRLAGRPGTIDLENAPEGLTLTAHLQDNGVTVLEIPTEDISYDEGYIGTLVWPEPAGRLTVQWLEGATVLAFETVTTTAFGPGYTTVDDLRLALAPGGNTGPGSAAGMPDEELADAIDEAQQEIDARLSDRYAVPFDPVPGLVARITRDFAAWGATLTHRRGNPLSADDPIRLRYAEAKALLLQIAKGEVDLVGAGGADVETGGGGEATLVNPYDNALFSARMLGICGVGDPNDGPAWP